MIISVHVRKCAGTTFRLSLQNYFEDSLLLDYGDEIGSSWPSSLLKRQQSLDVAKDNKEAIQSDRKIIHGHFYRDKYDFLDVEKKYITWMRDPVTRVLSNYFYLTRQHDRKNPDALVVNKLGFSLEEYIQHPDARNLQSQYLVSQTLNEFDFVGITEQYSASLRKLNEMFNINLELNTSENVNEKASNDYEIPTRLISLIKNCNLDDLRLYEKALDRFDKDGK